MQFRYALPLLKRLFFCSLILSAHINIFLHAQPKTSHGTLSTSGCNSKYVIPSDLASFVSPTNVYVDLIDPTDGLFGENIKLYDIGSMNKFLSNELSENCFKSPYFTLKKNLVFTSQREGEGKASVQFVDQWIVVKHGLKDKIYFMSIEIRERISTEETRTMLKELKMLPTAASTIQNPEALFEYSPKKLFKKKAEYIFTHPSACNGLGGFKAQVLNILKQVVEQRIPVFKQEISSTCDTLTDGSLFEIKLDNQVIKQSIDEPAKNGNSSSSSNRFGFHMRSVSEIHYFSQNRSLQITYFDYQQSFCDLIRNNLLAGKDISPSLHLDERKLKATTCELNMKVLPLEYQHNKWILRSTLFERNYNANNQRTRDQTSFLHTFLGYQFVNNVHFDLKLLAGLNAFSSYREKDRWNSDVAVLKPGEAIVYNVRLEGGYFSDGLSIKGFVQANFVDAYNEPSRIENLLTGNHRKHYSAQPGFEAGINISYRLDETLTVFAEAKYFKANRNIQGDGIVRSVLQENIISTLGLPQYNVQYENILGIPQNKPATHEVQLYFGAIKSF